MALGGYLILEARLVLALVLLIGSTAKLLSLDSTVRTFDSYLKGAFARGVNRPQVAILCCVELGIAMPMLLGWMTHVVAVMALALTVGFAYVSIHARRRKSVASCGCFGRIVTDSNANVNVLRNALLVGLALLLLIWPGQSVLSVDGFLAGARSSSSQLSDAIPITLIGIATVGILLQLELIVTISRLAHGKDEVAQTWR
jgi:uncharacterized membrane protein YphA (DoxX/SURF4 family)